MDNPAPVLTPDEIRSRLEGLRTARGYVLPHHGAMAASAPDLHDAYLAMYRTLTLTDRHLDAFEKEFIWLAILAAQREPAGTHHLELFRKAGGTPAQAALAFQLAGYAAAADAFEFAATHWQDWHSQADTRLAYLDGATVLERGAVDHGLASLALLAVQTTRRCAWGIRIHLIDCYEAGVSEDKIAESLSLLIWPAGVNRFVDACGIWHALMVEGTVQASPRYRAWADTRGQGRLEPLTPAIAD